VVKILNKVIPVFIGGTGRSGTTITLELLGQHSNFYASNPLEVRIVTENDGLLDSFENNSLENFNTKAELFWFNRTKQNEGLYKSVNKETINKMTKELNENFIKNSKDATRQFYIDIFKNQDTFKSDKLYIGDSTPSNIRYSNRINKIFPEAKFIHTFRDGRDAAYSIYLMRKYFNLAGNKTEFDALDWWYDRIVQSFSALNDLDNDKYISIRFEDLIINQRKKSFLKILNFLNLEEEENISNYFNLNVKKENMKIGLWKTLYTSEDFDNKYTEMLLKLKEQNIIIEKYY
jgi:hypothetical protein